MSVIEELEKLKQHLQEKESLILRYNQYSQNMLEGLSCPACIVNRNKGIVAANKQAIAAGVEIGGSCFSSIGMITRACPQCQADEVMSGKPSRRVQTITNGKIWDTHWVKLNDEHFLHFAYDITEQKQMEIELHKSEEKFRLLFEKTLDGYALHQIVCDPSGTPIDYLFLDINPAFEKLTGLKKEDIVGKRVKEIMPDIEDFWIETYGKVALTGMPMIFDHFNRSLNRHYEVSAYCTKPGFFATAFTDITQKLEMNNILEKKQKLESLGTLSAGIAHDFNNLLTAILGAIDTASCQLEKQNPEAAAQALLKALPAHERASRLTQELLTFSRGGLPDKKTISIKNLIQECIDLSFCGADVTLEVDLEDLLWNIEADDAQLHQALQNIFINARQAMPDGGKVILSAINVELPAENSRFLPQGIYVQIDITDTGGGISDDIIKHIFDPYFTTKTTGSGLGLAVTYSIINKHQGHIDVKATPTGTTFTILLPATWKEIVPAQVATGHAPTPPCGEMILVMDDEEVICAVIADMLTLLGYTPVISRNGDEAITSIKGHLANGNPIKKVILDLSISKGKGGAATLKDLHKLDPDIQAVVSTGYSDDPVIANHHAYGFSAILNKPYKMNTLKEVLANL